MLGNPEQTSPSEGLVGRKMKHFMRAVAKAEGRERELAWWDRGKRHWRTEAAEMKASRWDKHCVCSSGAETRSEAIRWGAVGSGTICYRETMLLSFACA